MSDPMRRVRLVETGWDRDLEIEEETADPRPLAPNEVEVAVEACGVCYRDLIDRDGRFPFLKLPITPGHEVVGRVVRAGANVGDWRVGDRVGTMHRDSCGQCTPCARGETSLCPGTGAIPGLLIDGGYADRMRGPERLFFAVPEEIPAEAAAVMHCTFGTAYRALTRGRGIGRGDRVLVTGANGGVGVAAIQVAVRLGGRVVAVVREPSHEAFLRGLGAEEVVVDDGGHFHKALGSPRVDVALDCVGPPTFNASLRSLRLGGRLVVIGNVVPEKVELNLGYLVTSAVEIFGSSGASREHMREVFALHAAAPFQVPLAGRLALPEADAAQRRLRRGGVRGRLVLVPERRR